jgi:hypothetical protein
MASATTRIMSRRAAHPSMAHPPNSLVVETCFLII